MSGNGLFQGSFGDMLDGASQSGSGSTDPKDLAQRISNIERVQERIVTLLTSPIDLYNSLQINWHGKTGEALAVKADTGCPPSGMSVRTIDGQEVVLGAGLYSRGVIANQLVNRLLYTVPASAAQAAITRKASQLPDPGTGYGQPGYGTGKAADDAGQMAVLPNQIWSNDFVAEYLRLAQGNFIYEGVLTTTLNVATNALTGATTAGLQTYVVDPNNPTNYMNGPIVTITNRDTGLSAVAGKYCIAMAVSATEIRPIWVAC